MGKVGLRSENRSRWPSKILKFSLLKRAEDSVSTRTERSFWDDGSRGRLEGPGARMVRRWVVGEVVTQKNKNLCFGDKTLPAELWGVEVGARGGLINKIHFDCKHAHAHRRKLGRITLKISLPAPMFNKCE